MSGRITDTDIFEDLAIEELEGAREVLRARDRVMIRRETALEALEAIQARLRRSWIIELVCYVAVFVILVVMPLDDAAMKIDIIVHTIIAMGFVTWIRFAVARKTRFAERARIARRLLAHSPRAMGLSVEGSAAPGDASADR